MHTGEFLGCDDLDDIEDDAEEIEPDDDGDSGNAIIAADTKNKTPVELVLRLAQGAELFHTPDGKQCATVRRDNKTEHHYINSKPFKDWLIHGYYKEHKKTLPATALQVAISQLEANARYEGPIRTLFVRVGNHGSTDYIDLANDSGQVIAIDQEGWRIVDDPPVAFRRPSGMLPLQLPTRGGSLDPLRPLVNLSSDADWLLFVALLTSYFRYSGPFPLMVLQGEQGCAKSTTARIVKHLIDPTAAPLRSLPKDIRDCMVAAQNTRVMAFDNISHLPGWLSDCLCQLSTGGGLSTRRLYADEEETIFDVQGPVVVNGITEIVERPDLADRSVFFHLPVITEEKRSADADLKAAIASALPGAMGALLDLIVEARKRLPGITLPRKPRMADFALWGEAVCRAMGKPDGEFIAAYTANRKDATSATLDVDPVAVQIRALMKDRDHWEGTCTALHKELEKIGGDDLKRQKDWPNTPKGLRESLKRLAPALRSTGIDLEFGDRTGAGRRCPLIHIRRTVPLGLEDQPKDEPCEAPARLVEQSPPPSSEPTQPAGRDYYGSGSKSDSFTALLASLRKSSRPSDGATSQPADSADDEDEIPF